MSENLISSVFWLVGFSFFVQIAGYINSLEDYMMSEESCVENNQDQAEYKEDNASTTHMGDNCDQNEQNVKESQSSFSQNLSEQEYHNIQALDINSADEVSFDKTMSEEAPWQCLTALPSIQTMTTFLLNKCHNYRQTMKAVLTGKQSCHLEDDNNNIASGDMDVRHECKSEMTSNNASHEDATEKQRSESEQSTSECSRTSNAKKRGRPLKAGPSKRAKKYNRVEDLYQGKLSNMVNRNYDSSDDDEIYW